MNRNTEKWDNRYLDLAKQVATWSKDPSTQIGAVAVGDKGQILATGYNGFPRGIYDSPDRYEDRSVKYKMIVHAEMNCIYNATYNGVSLNNSTLYVYGLPICSECAKGIIQVGISKVVMKPIRMDERWIESFELSKILFNEAGVEFNLITNE